MSPSEPSVRAGQKTGMSFYTEKVPFNYPVWVENVRKSCIHFICPVVYRFLIIDLFAKPVDKCARGPNLTRLVLLLEHLVEDGHEPVLELAVVIVGHNQVPDAVHAAAPQVRTVHVEVSEVCLTQAFDEVFLDTPCRGDNRADVLVLDEVKDDFA